MLLPNALGQAAHFDRLEPVVSAEHLLLLSRGDWMASIYLLRYSIVHIFIKHTAQLVKVSCKYNVDAAVADGAVGGFGNAKSLMNYGVGERSHHAALVNY